MPWSGALWTSVQRLVDRTARQAHELERELGVARVDLACEASDRRVVDGRAEHVRGVRRTIRRFCGQP